MTYVNHIGKDNGLAVAGVGGLLVDHRRMQSAGRILSEPDAFLWRDIYALPDQQGRLHVTAQTALRGEGERIIRLDLTARGIPKDTSEKGRRPWFDMAHDWITHGFAEVTDLEIQQNIWDRK